MSLVLRLPSLTPRRTAEKYMSIVVVCLAQRPKKQDNISETRSRWWFSIICQEIQHHVQNPNVENCCVTLGTRKLNSI